MEQREITYRADGLITRGPLFFQPAAAPRAGVLVFPEAFDLGGNVRRHVRRLEAAA